MEVIQRESLVCLCDFDTLSLLTVLSLSDPDCSDERRKLHLCIEVPNSMPYTTPDADSGSAYLQKPRVQFGQRLSPVSTDSSLRPILFQVVWI